MGIRTRDSKEQALTHAAHWARPQQGTLTYVALGDSAGVGIGVTDPRRGYVGLITQRLGEATGQSVRTVNLSVSGARAHDVLNTQIPRLSEMASPDFITCVVGGNDVSWTPFFRAHEFRRTAYAIASGLPQGSVLGLVPRFLHWPYENRARKANEALRAAAETHRHAIADIYARTSGLSLLRYRRLLAGDYFHPSEAGHQVWADAIWEQLAPR